MMQPAHLDSFLRLLVSHMGAVIDQGEKLVEAQSSQSRMDMLLHAIEQVDCNAAHEKSLTLQRDNERLFVEQMKQLREWADMLGRFDLHMERNIDEFLAATLFMERFSYDCSGGDLASQINMDVVLNSIFELLGRLEERYGLMEVMMEDERRIVNGPSVAGLVRKENEAKIIPLFPQYSR